MKTSQYRFLRFVSLLLLSLCICQSFASSGPWSSSRGGAEAASGDSSLSSSSVLTRFLERQATCSSSGDARKETGVGRFYIQGWRWHTMSLINEAHKLQSLAERVMQIDSSDEGSFTVSGGEAHEALQQASDYIVNFNMKGLRRIEKDLFFPWALKKVSELVLDRDVAYAFRSMMDDLEKEGKNLVNLGDSLMNRVAHMKSSTASIPHFEQVATTSAAIASGAQKMLQIEDSYLVPTIAAIVPAKEQKSFNDKVIRNLGIFDSRLYLVGMYRALQDLNDRKELNLFDDSIPILARKMIPWWTRSLYEPRVGKALDFGRKTDGP